MCPTVIDYDTPLRRQGKEKAGPLGQWPSVPFLGHLKSFGPGPGPLSGAIARRKMLFRTRGVR